MVRLSNFVMMTKLYIHFVIMSIPKIKTPLIERSLL